MKARSKSALSMVAGNNRLGLRCGSPSADWRAFSAARDCAAALSASRIGAPGKESAGSGGQVR